MLRSRWMVVLRCGSLDITVDIDFQNVDFRVTQKSNGFSAWFFIFSDVYHSSLSIHWFFFSFSVTEFMEMPELRRAMTMMQKVCPAKRWSKRSLVDPNWPKEFQGNQPLSWFSMPWRDGVVSMIDLQHFADLWNLSSGLWWAHEQQRWGVEHQSVKYLRIVDSLLLFYTLEKYRKTAV